MSTTQRPIAFAPDLGPFVEPPPFVPSSWHLEQQMAEADRKFAADRKRALEERFGRAVALNRAGARERHENALIQMPRRGGFKAHI